MVSEVHFLLVTAAMQGHMNPMLKLAKRLVSKGIHVTLAANDVARHRILNSRVSSDVNFPGISQNPTTPALRLAFFSDGLSPEFDRDEDVSSFIHSMKTTGAKNLSNLISDLTNPDRKFSCVIFNPFFPWIVEVASDHGIPCAALWIQACKIYSVYYHFFKYPDLFPSFQNPEELVQLPGMPVLQVKNLPSFILPSSPPAFYQTLSELVQKLDKVKWVLGNSFAELEEDTVKCMADRHPIHPVGPLVSPFLLDEEEIHSVNDLDMWSAENACIEWLSSKPDSSVIYISFGSITVLSQKQMNSLAMALKNSKRPFLWVIKPKPRNCNSKGGELPDNFLEETKERGLVVKWCVQEKVLMNKAVSCFMTHCGWNSALESIAAGKPVIAYPGWTDQPTVAELLVDVLKIGVRVKIEDGIADPEEIERCIMEISDGEKAEEMKKKALELKETAKKAVAKGGSSDRNLDRFISEITK